MTFVPAGSARSRRWRRACAAIAAVVAGLGVGCARTGASTASSAASVAAPAVDREALRADVARMMDESAKAWNRGDLDAFVAYYLPSDRTTFIGRNGVLHGVAAIRQVYAPRFAPGGVRDSLSFERLEVDPLAPGVVEAIAYYVLSRGDSVVARGPTSLVLLNVGGAWRIVHDHSS